ncbi:hypothetical protein L9F63_003923, partial [Diploptera punctata]
TTFVRMTRRKVLGLPLIEYLTRLIVEQLVIITGSLLLQRLYWMKLLDVLRLGCQDNFVLRNVCRLHVCVLNFTTMFTTLICMGCLAGLTNPIRPFVNLQGSRCRVASSVRYIVPKDSFSAVSAVEVFTVTLTRGPHKVLSSSSPFFNLDWDRLWRVCRILHIKILKKLLKK